MWLVIEQFSDAKIAESGTRLRDALNNYYQPHEHSELQTGLKRVKQKSGKSET